MLWDYMPAELCSQKSVFVCNMSDLLMRAAALMWVKCQKVAFFFFFADDFIFVQQAEHLWEYSALFLTE